MPEVMKPEILYPCPLQSPVKSPVNSANGALSIGKHIGRCQALFICHNRNSFSACLDKFHAEPSILRGILQERS